MPVQYDKPEDADPRAGGFWRLPDQIQAALRPPGVIVVSPVPEQRRRGRVEATRLHDWSSVAALVAQADPALKNGSSIDGALLERAAELLRAISSNPSLPVAAGRKPVAKATVATTLQEMLAAAAADQINVHDLIAVGPNGRAFLQDLCAFGWIDDGAAAAAIFSHTASCADDETERAQNRIAQENDPGAAVRFSSKPEDDPFHRDHTPDALRRATQIARAVAEALDPLTDDQLDQMPPLLARELARVVLRDRREVDLKLKASSVRRGLGGA